MHHIVYLSSAVIEMSEEALKALLLHSRRRNQARAITGLLLFSGGDILQVLEGEQQAVQALYDVIARDIRHTHLYKLADGPVPRRTFPDWSMGFVTTSPEKFAQLAGYRNPDSADFLATRPHSMDRPFFEMLQEFAAAHTTSTL
jgi:Sensors of blue-light using FAD